MVSILVLAGSSVIPPSVVAMLFVASAGVGALLTWAVSMIRLRQIRRLLGLVAMLVVAVPQIISDICNYCWWCLECWF